MVDKTFSSVARSLHAQSMEMALNAPEYHRVSKVLSDPYMTDHVLSQYWARYESLVWARDVLSALAPFEKQVLSLIQPSKRVA